MRYYYINILIACCILFSYCNTGSSKTKTASSTIQSGVAVKVDTFPAECPFLTKDNHNNVVLGWARSINDSVSVFCYAVSPDGGKSFGETIVIPGSDNLKAHAENLPKIIYKPSGEIIALWGASNPDPRNKYSGLVYYTQSFDHGKTWNKAIPLVTDTSGYDQRYYDVDLLPSGEAAITWLDNRKQSAADGSALYFASTSGRSGFKNERMITEGCCQCCRTDLFIDSSGRIHVLYRGIIQDSIRDMLHSVSTDGGNKFSDPRLISNDRWILRGCPHTGPAMTENKKGIHFAWYTGGNNKGCYYTLSGDNGESFVPRQQVSNAGSHPQITTTPSEKLIIVWDEFVNAGDAPNKRIAVQIKNPDGEDETRGFVTSDSTDSSYPVVASTKNNGAVIAYLNKENKKTYVMFQRVDW
ncbi:exo-alpha-sialidase [Pollutibacter soli]|uniref:exo-alpha-sialidase n=1 Tax=Pollutibacter soli TaxID=3034157 RepID=UPI003013EBF5